MSYGSKAGYFLWGEYSFGGILYPHRVARQYRQEVNIHINLLTAPHMASDEISLLAECGLVPVGGSRMHPSRPVRGHLPGIRRETLGWMEW